MRILDETYLSEDEEYSPAARVAEKIEGALHKLKMDSYNKRYVVRVTVDEVTETSDEDDDDESI